MAGVGAQVTPGAPGFWRGRRVLLTGHTGFKGAWLAVWLQRLGARVAGFSLPPPTSPSLFDALALEPTLDHTIGDVRDAAAVRACVERVSPDIVFHLAAQPLVRESYRVPADTFATNVLGTAHVLDAVRACPSVRAMVCVTTDKCYENREWTWGYRESDRLGGRDPYSASKAAAELVLAAYRQSFFEAPDGHGAVLVTARAGNVIGGGDWSADRILPDAVRAFTRGEPLRIRRPAATRPWQHVLEPLGGYLQLAERAATDGRAWQGAWNFGPLDDDVVSVRELVASFAAHWGEGAAWVAAPDDGPHEAHLLKLDISKARSTLGWTPRWRLDRALRETAEGYAAMVGGSRGTALRAILDAQIARYCG
jgi:CDP-glucose 4,6-dehydratase